MTVSGITDIDREPYIVAGLTKQELKIFALFFLVGLAFLLFGVVLAVLNRNSITPTAIGLGTLSLGYLVAKTPPPSGWLKSLRRALFGPHTYVNGPITTLPKEYQTRSYRRAQRRLAVLSAPFDGFDEAGRYIVNDGVTRVLKVNPIDMELRSEREREQLGKRFAHLLNTSDEPIIPILTSEPISFEQEINRLRRLKLAPQVNAQAADYADFLASLSGHRRQVYIPCWGTDALAADLRASTVTEQLQRMGLDVHRPTPSEMAALTALISGGNVPHRNYPSEPTLRGA